MNVLDLEKIVSLVLSMRIFRRILTNVLRHSSIPAALQGCNVR